MSDLQRDIDVMDSLVRQLNGWGLSSEESSAWQRIRARLEAAPDRENLTAVLQDAALSRAINIDHYDARLIVDAVIAAITGDTK